MTWDFYFRMMTDTVALNSKCMSRKVGAILVKDKSVIATGYNGPPRGVPHCGDRYFEDDYLAAELEKADKMGPFPENVCPRRAIGAKSGERLDLCIAGHAERNCIVNAARHGVNVKGSTLYLNTDLPCKDSLIEIINAGIVEVVTDSLNVYHQASDYLREHSGILFRIHSLWKPTRHFKGTDIPAPAGHGEL